MVDLNARQGPLEAIEKLQAGGNPVPVIGFLSHVQTDLAERAQAAGCKQVMPRSSFTAESFGDPASGKIVNCVVHGREGLAARHFSSLARRAGAAGLLLALVFGASARIAAAQRGASAAAIAAPDPAEALGETLTAACRQDQAGFANHLTSDSAEAYRALPEQQRVALLRRFVLLDDPGKALLSTLDGHTVVRCEASGVVSEMRFGESQVRENLAFISVTVPAGRRPVNR